jgi:hypothetical protein
LKINLSFTSAELTQLAAQRYRAGNIAGAAELSGAALASDPHHAPALHVHGLIAYRLGHATLACALLESAIARDGSQQRYYLDLIQVYRFCWRLDDALRVGLRAAELWPEDAAVQYTMSFVDYDRGNLDDAVARLRRVIARQPRHAGAHMRLGQTLLAGGDCKPGWPEYEWRFSIPGWAPVMPPTSKPKWDGKSAPGRTLLLVCAEGFGDTIQYVRYIPRLAQACGRLVIMCSAEMRPFVIQQEGGTDAFQNWAELPAYDAYCVLTSVPGLMNTDVAAPPAPVPYIRADPEHAKIWRERLGAAIPAGLYRIGLVWAGRPTHPNNRRRSINSGQLIALTAVTGVALVGLQKGETTASMPKFKGPAPFLDVAAQIGDFADTAACIENLDLVIAVDTATAHLAGAMGKPVWLLLPYAPDWRWQMRRDDTPWYPTMRLFRQPRPGDWSGVIDTITHELRKIVTAGA